MGVILFRFVKPFANDATATKGDTTPVTATLAMNVNDAVIDYFNIPTPVEAELTEALAARSTTIPTFTYTRYKDAGEATGELTTVTEHSRTSGGGGRGTIKNVARVPMETKLAAKSGKPRTTSFKFPSFFTVYMIDQAIGSAIKNNQPRNYELRGKKRLFIPNASTAVLSGLSGGAWVVTTYEAAVNEENTDAVGAATMTSSGRPAKMSTPAPTPAP